MRYPFFLSVWTCSFSPMSSWKAGKASPRMYRCPLLVPLPGCHLVLLLCHFSCMIGFQISSFVGTVQMISRSWQGGWISTWSFGAGLFRSSSKYSTRLFLCPSSLTIETLFFVFYGSLWPTKYSIELYCFGVDSSHFAVVSCFICFDSSAIQVCSLICSAILFHHFVGLCVCCLCSDFLWAGATVVERNLFFCSSIFSGVSVVVQSLWGYFFEPNTCWHEDVTAF